MLKLESHWKQFVLTTQICLFFFVFVFVFLEFSFYCRIYTVSARVKLRYSVRWPCG